MRKALMLSFAMLSLTVLAGCQSPSSQIQAVAVSCPKPAAPEAWFMLPTEPKLTQRLLNELSPSSTTETTQSGSSLPAKPTSGQ